jgi:ParB/RepB/Spo0J family partition protein
MTSKHAPQNKKGSSTKPARVAMPPVATPPVQHKPVLGVNLKGELRDVELAKVIDPQGASDRMERAGDAERIAQMAQSLREVGQLQPVMLEELADGRFCRVFGRRRIAAARSIGMETIRAVVVPPLGEDVRRTVVAVENVQRQDLTPPEETLAVGELIELKAFDAAIQMAKPLTGGPLEVEGVIVTRDLLARECSKTDKIEAWRRAMLGDHRVRSIAYEMVAAMLAKPVSWVRDRAYIGRLDAAGQAAVRDGRLPLAHAREIARVADPVLRAQFVKDFAAGGRESISKTEPGKLEELQREVKQRLFTLHTVPWKLDVPFAGKPACTGCPHNSQSLPGLFDGGGMVSTEMRGGKGTYGGAEADGAKVEAAGVCTMATCYAAKLREAKGLLSSAAKTIVDSKGKPSTKAVTILKHSAIESRVKDRINLKKQSGRSASAKAKKVEKDPAQKKREARQEAYHDWKYGIERWAKELEPKLAKVLAAKPGAWAMYHLATETKLHDSIRSGSEAQQAKRLASPEMARLLKLISGEPSFEAIIELAKGCGQQHGLINAWYDGQSGWAAAVAKAFNIQHGHPPVVEDFLSTEYGGKKQPAEKPRPVAGKVGKAKKSSPRIIAESAGPDAVEGDVD